MAFDFQRFFFFKVCFSVCRLFLCNMFCFNKVLSHWFSFELKTTVDSFLFHSCVHKMSAGHFDLFI